MYVLRISHTDLTKCNESQGGLLTCLLLLLGESSGVARGEGAAVETAVVGADAGAEDSAERGRPN